MLLFIVLIYYILKNIILITVYATHKFDIICKNTAM
jgi:hypothetical protein